MKKKMKMGTILAFAVLDHSAMSILAPLIAPYDPLKIDMANALEEPGNICWERIISGGIF